MKSLTEEQRKLAGDGQMLRLAVWWASEYARTSQVELAELRAVAYLATVQAARTYRPGGTVAFASHATRRIRWALLEAITQRSHECTAADFDSLCQPDPSESQAEWVHEILATLSTRERDVLVDSVVYGKTMLEIGKAIGITRQRTHQIYDRAIHTLRERFAGDLMEETDSDVHTKISVTQKKALTSRGDRGEDWYR